MAEEDDELNIFAKGVLKEFYWTPQGRSAHPWTSAELQRHCPQHLILLKQSSRLIAIEFTGNSKINFSVSFQIKLDNNLISNMAFISIYEIRITPRRRLQNHEFLPEIAAYPFHRILFRWSLFYFSSQKRAFFCFQGLLRFGFWTGKSFGGSSSPSFLHLPLVMSSLHLSGLLTSPRLRVQSVDVWNYSTSSLFIAELDLLWSCCWQEKVKRSGQKEAKGTGPVFLYWSPLLFNDLELVTDFRAVFKVASRLLRGWAAPCPGLPLRQRAAVMFSYLN